MARWKIAGQLAVAMREAERQAAEKRLLEEQRQESMKNGTILRSLKRSRDRAGQKAKASNVSHNRWFQTLDSVTDELQREAEVAGCRQYQKEDEFHKKEVLLNIKSMDNNTSTLNRLETAIEMVRIKEKETDREIAVTRRMLRHQILTLDHMRVASQGQVEGRIQLAHEQLGMQLAQNRRLVKLIQHLERQRDQVNEIHGQLRQHLEDLSKQLGGHVEEAQSTYEQRDMNKRNMQKLREHLSKSSLAHANDMQNLQFKINVLRRMEDFMMTKNKFRPDQGRERRKENRRQLSSMKRDTLMLGELMKKIKTDLQEQDVHKIVNTFVELQSENFMLFTNISHIREGCHNLKGQVVAKRAAVVEKRVSKEREKMEVEAQKSELGEQINLCRQVAEKKEEEVREADKMINTYIRAVKAMLTHMNYTREDISRLAGGFKSIEERNITAFLAEIEHYVNKLHCLDCTLEHMHWRRARRLSLSMTGQSADALPPRQPALPRVVVVPPQMEGWVPDADEDHTVTSSSDTNLRPFELWELTAQVGDALGDKTPMSEEDIGTSD